MSARVAADVTEAMQKLAEEAGWRVTRVLSDEKVKADGGRGLELFLCAEADA